MEAKVKTLRLCLGLLVVWLFGTAPISRAQEAPKAEEKAQTAPEDTRNWPVKMFQVKHANVHQLANVFKAFGAIINADDELKVISVRAPKEVVAAIEEAIQRLDVPQPPAKNIQLDAYLLIASVQGSSGNVPADLQPVVKQLKNIFNYQDFRLLGTLSMRVRDAENGTVSGLLPSVSANVTEPTSYRFHMNKAAITSEGKERSVRINGLELRMGYALKGLPPHGEAQISTSVDVREGQRVVVGKANMDSADNALILVLTAQVVE
jgi:hypothetical protein